MPVFNYKLKPEITKANQLAANNLAEILSWTAGVSGTIPDPANPSKNLVTVTLTTSMGTERAVEGDWIMQSPGTGGAFDILNNTDFVARYERAV